MKLPDGSTLMHGSVPYDPAKAHAYYLKVRQLKGRKPGLGKPKRANLSLVRESTFNVKTREGVTVKLTATQLQAQKEQTAKRVNSIKKKLGLLNAELKKRMAEARQSEREAKKAPTAADKSKAARDSAQYRDKHKQQLKNKGKRATAEPKSNSKPNTVAELKQTIADVQKSLAAAVDRQRSLTAAKKNGVLGR